MCNLAASCSGGDELGCTDGRELGCTDERKLDGIDKRELDGSDARALDGTDERELARESDGLTPPELAVRLQNVGQLKNPPFPVVPESGNAPLFA